MLEHETGTDFLELIENPDVIVDEEERNTLMCIYAKHGNAGVRLHLQETLGKWENVEVSFAVTGRSGVGKSSFINVFRGLTAEEDGAAKVNATKPTTTVTPYKHPLNPKFVLWDLPGVGTPTNPRKTYLTDIEVDKYDVFLLLSAGKFTEDDMWLAGELKKRNKTFFYIRTKVQQDIDNLKYDKPGLFQGDKNAAVRECLRIIAKDLETNLMSTLQDPEIFLIDNHDIKKFEFGKLCDKLVDVFQRSKAEKADAVFLTMNAYTSRVNKEKEVLLRKRIWRISLLAFLDIFTKCSVLNKEAQFYRRQLGLDTNALQKLARKRGVSLPTLSSNVKTAALDFPTKTPSEHCPLHTFLVEKRPTEWVNYNPLSWLDKERALDSFLSMCLEDAKELYKTE